MPNLQFDKEKIYEKENLRTSKRALANWSNNNVQRSKAIESRSIETNMRWISFIHSFDDIFR